MVPAGHWPSLGWVSNVTLLVFAHNLTRKEPILEGNIPFESLKCPLQGGLIRFYKSSLLKKINCLWLVGVGDGTPG